MIVAIIGTGSFFVTICLAVVLVVGVGLEVFELVPFDSLPFMKVLYLACVSGIVFLLCILLTEPPKKDKALGE